MPEPARIVRLQTVALTREKQTLIEREIDTYCQATNFAIKNIMRRRIAGAGRAVQLLRDEIARHFILRSVATGQEGVSDAELRDRLAERLDLDIIKKRMHERFDSPEMWRREFALRYELQYVKDVVKTARVEIGRHRRLAKTIRSIRDRPPHFKRGRMIVSGVIVEVSQRALLPLLTDGTVLPLVFDRRSRSRARGVLERIDRGEQPYGRVRLTWNRAGYVDIDIRLES